jgi:hypothetical protein
LNRIALARSEAQAYAARNLVLGHPLRLQLPAHATDNPPDGDVVFAFLGEPRGVSPSDRVLRVADLDGFLDGQPFLPLVNTVRVNARRTRSHDAAVRLWGGVFTGCESADVVARATATVDRDVIGFRPICGQPVPLMPIALFTRHGQPPPDAGLPNSWEDALRAGTDMWRCDRTSGVFASGSDGLPEATMVMSTDITQLNALLLLIGTGDFVDPKSRDILLHQIATGLNDADLKSLGGAFTLAPSTNRLIAIANPGVTDFYAALASQLNLVQGQKRIWPLYESVDPTNSQAVIVGFVAARLVQANATANGLTLVLQPCQLSTRTALTDAGQRGVGGVNITNPYICRVRLVE